MKPMFSLGLKFDGQDLWVLDQQRLPDEEVWIRSNSPEIMISCIKSLKIRGAPLLGVAAALSLAHYARSGVRRDDLILAAKALREARPTAVNLMAAVDRMLPQVNDLHSFVSTAETIFDEDVALCESMARNGAALVRDGENLLTHCNSGGLATAGIGTAFGVLRKAHELGKKVHVYVDETRPLLQGGRLTAWELGKLGVPYTLICDNMAGALMRAGKIQRIFVGADRIAANGDFANKIGTYSVAVLARHHGIPFHPVAPYTTVDLSCASGAAIPIEEREQAEVRGAAGAFGAVQWAPKGCKVFNPSFDVTPVELVDSLVLDKGVYTRNELQAGALLKVLR